MHFLIIRKNEKIHRNKHFSSQKNDGMLLYRPLNHTLPSILSIINLRHDSEEKNSE